LECEIHPRFGDRILAGSGSLLPGIPQADFRLCSQAARWIMTASRPVRQQVALEKRRSIAALQNGAAAGRVHRLRIDTRPQKCFFEKWISTSIHAVENGVWEASTSQSGLKTILNLHNPWRF